MRDDIHKGAPVKTHWRTVAQVACGSSTRWEKSGASVATAAARTEMQDISDGLLAQLDKAIAAPTQVLTPLFPGRRTEAERELIEFYELSRAKGERDDLQALLRRTLISRMTKISRELKCHAMKKDPSGSGEFMRRVRRSLDAIGVDAAVARRTALWRQGTSRANVDLRTWNQQ